LGDTGAAVARLDRIIGEGNAPRDAAIALARVHLEAHDYRAAISALDAIEASGEAAKDGELHYLRGVALLYGGRSADAIVELELARRNLGSDSDVEFHLGLAHLQCKQIREARTFFSAYLSLNPDGRYAEMARDLMRQ
jgi:tetratricopeptide (TPR) repeat protein